MDLQKLKDVASKCTLCDLHKGRLNPVFHKGNPNALIMVCGMVPAYEENKQGLPFVGRSGQLLDVILNDAGLSLDDVYITNIVKCFLAPGIKLDPVWVNSCYQYLMVQITIVKPMVIITLGADASIGFLRLPANTTMGSIKGDRFYFDGIKVYPTYHPSYLIRGGGVKHKNYSDVLDAFIRAKEDTAGKSKYLTEEEWDLLCSSIM